MIRVIILFYILAFSNCIGQQKVIMPYNENKIYTFSIEYFDKSNKKRDIFFTPPFDYIEGKENEFENGWEIDSNNKNSILINRFSIETFNGKINRDQLPYLIYYHSDLNDRKIIGDMTGILQTKLEIMLHPPRLKYFSILEFNPFPQVYFPLFIDKTWENKIILKNEWNHKHAEKFMEQKEISYKYLITGKEVVATGIGNIISYKIVADSLNKKIPSYLISYFNEKYGFIKLEYLNLDGSKIIFLLESIHSKKE